MNRLEKAREFNRQFRAQQLMNAKGMGVSVDMSIEQQAELTICAIGDLTVAEAVNDSQWATGVKVTAGQTVTYEGKKYECVQAHITQADWIPSIVPALWKEVRETVSEWKQPLGSQDAYNIGDKVLYKGKTYESVINGNTWSPEAYPAGWKVV